ncbi:MAG: methylmalonyl Co-A mutase-associated GTPase MeaB [Firmicutes bacterium]|nr:methylmalonyl Co-A mutase-associated GTPase MeaB [Bacillota bacterium]
MMNTTEELVNRILDGDRLALARAITVVENESPGHREIVKAAYRHSGRAYVVGVTGSPGTGKSTLTDGLIDAARNEGKKVGVIAVDPTSPFTGGAILGDRIRMQTRSIDPDVFIRSLATRGHLGGLSRATGATLHLLDAFGCDVIFIETVGTGQSEVEIMRYAHTVVVVAAPGMGDDVQAMKAGIMEIGDVFAVNKADREGAGRTALEIEYMLDMSPPGRGWRPPVVKTVAVSGEGIALLASKISEHAAYVRQSGEMQKHALQASEFDVSEVLAQAVVEPLIEKSKARGLWDDVISKVASRELDPYTAVDILIESRKTE